jgi:hypothetical protein
MRTTLPVFARPPFKTTSSCAVLMTPLWVVRRCFASPAMAVLEFACMWFWLERIAALMLSELNRLPSGFF